MPFGGTLSAWDDFVDQRMHELAEVDDLGLLAVAAVQLQHFADDAVDALRVVADHAEEPRAGGGHRTVFLEQLRGLVDGRQRIAHFVGDGRRQAAERGELHLLRLVLGPAEVFEIDERSAVEAGADAHEPHAQEALGGLHLERRQRLGVVLLPAAPVVVQRRAEFREPHAAAHPAEPAQQARHLRVVAAHDAVEVDDEHAVLHVLNDEAVDLLQVRDVDAALGGELFRRFRVASERDGDADGGEIAESDEARLERLRTADAAFEHAPDVEAEQDEARDRGVEERRLRAQEPAARRQLRKQQDRQRAARAAAGDHHQRDAQDVAHQQRRNERRQAQREASRAGRSRT